MPKNIIKQVDAIDLMDNKGVLSFGRVSLPKGTYYGVKVNEDYVFLQENSEGKWKPVTKSRAKKEQSIILTDVLNAKYENTEENKEAEFHTVSANREFMNWPNETGFRFEVDAKGYSTIEMLKLEKAATIELATA